jgi:hypothetical protein
MKRPTSIQEITTFADMAGMTLTGLKKALAQRISEIDDKAFLEAIKTILDAKAESRTIQLSPDIASRIQTSREEIEQGQSIENEKLVSDLEAWLRQK